VASPAAILVPGNQTWGDRHVRSEPGAERTRLVGIWRWLGSSCLSGRSFPGCEAGMAGIVWGDERPRAVTGNKRPTLVGLEPVVMAAEPVQQLEQGVVARGPIDSVIRLQEVGPDPAAFGGACGKEPVKGALLVGVWPSAEMGYPDDVFAFGQDCFQEGIAALHDVGHGLSRQRAKACDFAALLTNGISPQQGGEVDTHHQLVAEACLRTAGGGEGHQAIEGVRLGGCRLPCLLAASKALSVKGPMAAITLAPSSGRPWVTRCQAP